MDWFMGKGRRKDKESPVPATEEHKQYLETEMVKEALPNLDLNHLESLTCLPLELDRDEWLATHTLSFFNHVNLLYGAISEYCTSTSCSSMAGPGNTQYLWFDEKGKKCKCAAPQYTDYVMTFIQKTIQEEGVFPTKCANPFPTSFEVLVKKIFRLLFHVMAHMYAAHFKDFLSLNLHGHLNTLFMHFILFSNKFSLIEEKDTESLDDLTKALNDLLSSQDKNAVDDNASKKSNASYSPSEGAQSKAP